MEYFVKVCQEDLVKGIISQWSGEKENAKSMKEVIRILMKPE